jgi:hypothetical protein
VTRYAAYNWIPNRHFSDSPTIALAAAPIAGPHAAPPNRAAHGAQASTVWGRIGIDPAVLSGSGTASALALRLIVSFLRWTHTECRQRPRLPRLRDTARHQTPHVVAHPRSTIDLRERAGNGSHIEVDARAVHAASRLGRTRWARIGTATSSPGLSGGGAPRGTGGSLGAEEQPALQVLRGQDAPAGGDGRFTRRRRRARAAAPQRCEGAS